MPPSRATASSAATLATLARAWAPLVLCACSACFVGYDSRWGSEARAQETVAKHATPKQLRGEAVDAPEVAVRVLKVRAYVSDRFVAEVTDAEGKVERLVGRANELLEPTLDLQLDLVGVKRWTTTAEGDLSGCLEELGTLDAAKDVDWVVGFVGQAPTLEVSFKRLGEARMSGRHWVMRAMNDAAEYDWIREELGELDEGERRDLYRKRVDHKEAAVFLHELGHTLGVPHARSSTAIMHAVYSHKADRFSDEAAQLMRISLRRRVDPSALTDRELAQLQVDQLQRSASIWEDDERDAWVKRLTPAPPSSATAMPQAFTDAARWRALSAQERSRFVRTLELEAAGQLQQALDEAEPLFSAHPDGYEIQELRCRIAMQVGGDVDAVLAHCERFNQLEKAPSP